MRLKSFILLRILPWQKLRGGRANSVVTCACTGDVSPEWEVAVLRSDIPLKCWNFWLCKCARSGAVLVDRMR